MGEQIDILGRGEFVERVINLISEISNNRKNSTFAIDGEWGSGKTFVLEMIENRLEDIQSEVLADNKYMVFHYNCWEYDYYDEPLIAIISAMLEKAENENKILNTAGGMAKAGWNKAFKELKNIAGEIVKNKIGVDPIHFFDEIRNDYNESVEDKYSFDTLYMFKETIKDMRAILNKMSKDKCIVIVVDELDRCFPEYSIKVLERLHHLFTDIENIIIIMAIDSVQISNIIVKTFGVNIDVDKYLKKFIDFSIKLNNGDITNRFSEKFKNIIDLYNFSNNKEIDIINKIAKVFYCDVDIRMQEKIINKIVIVHNLLSGLKLDISILGFELVWSIITIKEYNAHMDSIIELSHGYNDSKRSYLISNFIKKFSFEIVDEKSSIQHYGKTYYYLKDNILSNIWWYLASVYYKKDERLPLNFRAGLIKEDYEKHEANVEHAIKFKEFLELVR